MLQRGRPYSGLRGRCKPDEDRPDPLPRQSPVEGGGLFLGALHTPPFGADELMLHIVGVLRYYVATSTFRLWHKKLATLPCSHG